VPRAGTAKHLRIEGVGTLSLAGRVLDPDGNPVPNARVMASGMAEAEGSSGNSDNTDASGRFRVLGLKKGAYRVRAQATYSSSIPDFEKAMAPVEVAPIQAGTEDLDLRLRRPAWIEGSVLDETNQPVPDAWVVVYSAGGSGWGWGAMTDA